MTLQTVLLFLGACVGITAVVSFMVLCEPWRWFSPKDPIGQKNIFKLKTMYNAIAIALYKLIQGFALTNIYITNLAASLKHKYILDTDESRIKAASMLLAESIITVIGWILLSRYFDDAILTLIATIMVFMYVNQKLIGDGYRFLSELEETVGDIVHIYNAEGRNIDRMFNRVLKEQSSYTFRYMDQMYDYLKRSMMDTVNSQALISEYNRIVPSRHLRLIFNYIYITARYGDEVDEHGDYLFNKNMLAIQREIHSEHVKIKSIKDSTIGEQLFIMLSVLVIPVAAAYMEEFFTFEGFEVIGRFLASSIGYTVKIICGVVGLICFYIHNKMMKANTAFDDFQEIKWTEFVISKQPWIKRVIDKIAPKEGTPRRIRLETKIALAEGYAGIRPFYLKKLTLAITATVIVVLLLTFDTITIYNSINTDLYLGINKDTMDLIASLEEFPDRYKEKSLTNDLLVIDILNQNKEYYFSMATSEEQIAYIGSVIHDYNIDYGSYPEVAAKRIHEKYIELGQVKPASLVIIIICSFFAVYMVPNLNMRLNLMLNHGVVVHDEVIGCYTVVILLINHSSTNIYMILSWITSFAKVFRVRLQQCIDNLNEQEIKALEAGVDYKPFSRLIECILMAYNGADLKSAFAGIEQRHTFLEESRKQINEQIVKRRVAASSILSWTALGCTFLLYIMAPMVYAIVEMLSHLV